MQNAMVHAVRSPRAPNNSVASPLDDVGTPRSPCHGANFEHAQRTRRGSAF